MTNDYTEQGKELLYEMANGVVEYVDAYCRYSSHMQDEGNSIEYQMEDIERYCKQRGYAVRKWYIDKAKSAKQTAGRDGFYDLINDIKNGVSSRKLIVWRTNRTFRNAYESHKYRAFFREQNIKLESVTQTIDEDTSSGRLTTNILSDIDQYKSEEIAEHVTAAMKSMARKGLYTGSPVLPGYALEDCFDGDKPRKRYIIDEEKAVHIRKAFELYLVCDSGSQVANYLNENGILNSAGNIFDPNAALRLLHNDFFIGTRSFESKYGESVKEENCHPAIISKELFNAVQDAFENKREHHQVAGRLSRSQRVYALTGKIFCNKCGGSMFGLTTRNKQGTVFSYYTCKNRKRYKTCDCKFISKEGIEQKVLELIHKHIMSDEAIDRIANFVLGEIKAEPSNKKDKATLTKRKNELIAELAEMLQMKLSKQVTAEVYDIMRVDKERELSIITSQIESIEFSQNTIIDYDFIRDYIKKLFYDSNSTDGQVLKTLFKTVVDKVEVDDDKVMVYLVLSFKQYLYSSSSGFPNYEVNKLVSRADISKK